MSKPRKEAKLLADRPYTTVIFIDSTTEGEPIYVAFNPELAGCHSQGATPDEAAANLSEARIDYFEHFLEFGLEIPTPRTYDNFEGISINLPCDTQEDCHTSPEFVETPTF